MAEMKIDGAELLRDIEVQASVRFSRGFMLRVKIALLLMRLSAKIGGYGFTVTSVARKEAETARVLQRQLQNQRALHQHTREERNRMTLGIVRAKRQLGLSTHEEMKQPFFDSIWPAVLDHLKATGYGKFKS